MPFKISCYNCTCENAVSYSPLRIMSAFNDCIALYHHAFYALFCNTFLIVVYLIISLVFDDSFAASCPYPPISSSTGFYAQFQPRASVNSSLIIRTVILLGAACDMKYLPVQKWQNHIKHPESVVGRFWNLSAPGAMIVQSLFKMLRLALTRIAPCSLRL